MHNVQTVLYSSQDQVYVQEAIRRVVGNVQQLLDVQQANKHANDSPVLLLYITL